MIVKKLAQYGKNHYSACLRFPGVLPCREILSHEANVVPRRQFVPDRNYRLDPVQECARLASGRVGNDFGQPALASCRAGIQCTPYVIALFTLASPANSGEKQDSVEEPSIHDPD